MLLGFLCSGNGRTADPKKIEQLRKWPEYRNCKDIVSHLAFCNYLREFFGPDYSAATKPLREYLKKGADFSKFADDVDAQKARQWLVEQQVQHVILVQPDWQAAATPWWSGRPFEAFLDASDEAWCVVLCQRMEEGKTPKIICMISKSFIPSICTTVG